MTQRIPITEEGNKELIESWYQVKPNTPQELADFAKKLLEEYTHDYGTIVHAATALALAAAWTVDRDPTQGGLTGFQGGAIASMFVSRWLLVEGPWRRLEFNNMLYPQYHADFTTIPERVWSWVQEEAKKKLESSPDTAHPDVRNHWLKIVDGHVPFGLVVKSD